MANSDASRLYDDLLSNYNKLVRPVVNNTDTLQVFIKLKLSQLIDVVSKGLAYGWRKLLERNRDKSVNILGTLNVLCSYVSTDGWLIIRRAVRRG